MTQHVPNMREYRKTSGISLTNFQNLNVSCILIYAVVSAQSIEAMC